jgi:hypothetical protein
MNATTKTPAHELVTSRVNNFGKVIWIVDCAYQEQTVIIEYGNAGGIKTLCGCGIRLG